MLSMLPQLSQTILTDTGRLTMPLLCCLLFFFPSKNIVTSQWGKAREALLKWVLSGTDQAVTRSSELVEGITWGLLELNGCAILEPITMSSPKVSTRLFL